MAGRLQIYEGDSIRVTFAPDRCIHAGICVRANARVFNPRRRPWIKPEQATADSIADIVSRCPTGALEFQRLDDGPPESHEGTNTVEVIADGPLYARGSVRLETGEQEVDAHRVALCRCGASKNKPFCDNSHLLMQFQDVGALGSSSLGAEPTPGAGGLRIDLAPDGPIRLDGPFELRSADGTAVQTGERCALCRCGDSKNKPFCDGSHNSTGFEAA